MKKHLLIIFFLTVTAIRSQAGGDSAWSMHAGILYSKFSNTDSKVYTGLDLKAGYQFASMWHTGLAVQLAMLDDNTTSPYLLVAGGPFLRYKPGKVFIDFTGSIGTATIKKETITQTTLRLSLGAENNMSEHLFFTPQIYFQYETLPGKRRSEIWRPGVLLAIRYQF